MQEESAERNKKHYGAWLRHQKNKKRKREKVQIKSDFNQIQY